jgi:putative RecB family exonuclease
MDGMDAVDTVDAAAGPPETRAVAYTVPTSLSPSRVEAFTSCPMAFRFASIEKLPEQPAEHSTKGSAVHRVLEWLFTYAPAQRTSATALDCLARTRAEYLHDPEFVLLDLSTTQADAFWADVEVLVDNYFGMEDPTAIRDIGLELRLEATVGDLTLRGIIDRLELNDDGRLVVTDYKTGRSPGLHYEQSKLSGVHFYSFLCEQLFGQRPAAIRLMYLRSGEVITATPSAQSVRFITTRTTAVWKAVEKACITGDFRPRQGPLCGSCSFQTWCPAFGGDPGAAAHEAPLALSRPVAAA